MAIGYVESADASGGAKEFRGETPVVRVGSDLCSVSAVAGSMAHFGTRYLHRLFTEEELSYCFAAHGQMVAQRLAARFAAKEATFKVLRFEDRGFNWREVEVKKTPGGWCELRLSGSTAEIAAAHGVVSLDLSMSHEADMASAVVVAQLAPVK